MGGLPSKLPQGDGREAAALDWCKGSHDGRENFQKVENRDAEKPKVTQAVRIGSSPHEMAGEEPSIVEFPTNLGW